MEEWREKFIKQYGYDPMMFSGQDMTLMDHIHIVQ